MIWIDRRGSDNATLPPTAADIARDTRRRLIMERVERFNQAGNKQPQSRALAGIGGETRVIYDCPLCRALVDVLMWWSHWRGHEIDAELDRLTLEQITAAG